MSQVKVTGNASGTGIFTIESPNSNSNVTFTLPTTSGTVLTNAGPYTANASASNGAVTIDASNNVGIGTSSPSTYANGAAPTLVVGTGNNWVVAQPRTDGPAGIANGVRLAGNYLTNPKPGAAVWIGAAGGAGQRGVLAFFTKDTDDNTNEPTERARIDSSGNLLVGTTSQLLGTNARFNISFNNSTDYGAVLKAQSAGAFGCIYFANSGGTVQGSITSTGSGSTAYNTSSDYRLKHDIQPMTGALARVSALKPVTYKWNGDDSYGEGFIAHELQAVCPQAVTGEKDAVNPDGTIQPQGIDTSFLVATLTAAIQEQQALINDLTARIAALEAK